MESSKYRWIRNNEIVILISVLTFLHCFLCAYTAYTTVDFVAINGTYQNYNLIYRFLDGQIPYKDFACYIGMGPVLLGTLVTGFLGGDYAGSLVAMQFLSILSIWLLAFLVAYAVLESKGKALCLSSFIINLRLIVQSGALQNVPDFLNEFCGYVPIYVGNSARLVRGMILPLSIILILIFFKIIDLIENQFSENIIKTLRIALVAFVAAIAFGFSNDFGIGTWVCISLMVLIFVFFESLKLGNAIRIFAMYLILFGFFLCLIVFAMTKGDIAAWISGIFGSGSYQRWYYFAIPHDNAYLWNLDYTGLCMISLAFTCIYLVLFFRNRTKFKWALKRYGIMALLHMTVYAVANEYMLLSGDKLHEIMSALIYLTFVIELFGIIYKATRGYFQKNTLKTIALVSGGLMVLVGSGYRVIGYYETIQEQSFSTTYVEEFGGVLSNSLYADIIKAAEIIGDEPVFSTYASALEVYTHQFQPSGVDYIIHVLGDEKREAYLECFRSGDYKYVTTISPSYSQWEYWVQNANWFFYRELFPNYHPVAETGYQIIWEKNEAGEEIIKTEVLSVEVINNDTNMVTVTVDTKADFTGIVEVELDYEIVKRGSFTSKFIFNSTVYVQSPTAQILTGSAYHSYNLPDSGVYYVPIQVIEGQGFITLSSIPEQDTILHIKSVRSN